jgi:hypothetical protein
MLHAQYEGRETGYTYAREGIRTRRFWRRRSTRSKGARAGRHRLRHGGGHRRADGCPEGGRSRHRGEPALWPVAQADEPGPRAVRHRHQPRRPDRCRGDEGRDPARDADDPGRGRVEPDAARGRHGGDRRVAREAGVLLAVDNTFTTPRGWRPFEHGADIVIHSITKLLAGHSDVTLGYVAARDPAMRRAIYDFAVTTGLTPVALRMLAGGAGAVHLPLRYDRAEANAAWRWPRHLAAHPKVARVLYPGRADHPDARAGQGASGGADRQHGEFRDQGRRGGGRPDGAGDAPQLPFAPTLGDVGTTLSHPASSSHRALTPEGRAALGISDGFFRVSVGIEEIDLLIVGFRRGWPPSDPSGTAQPGRDEPVADKAEPPAWARGSPCRHRRSRPRRCRPGRTSSRPCRGSERRWSAGRRFRRRGAVARRCRPRRHPCRAWQQSQLPWFGRVVEPLHPVQQALRRGGSAEASARPSRRRALRANEAARSHRARPRRNSDRATAPRPRGGSGSPRAAVDQREVAPAIAALAEVAGQVDGVEDRRQQRREHEGRGLAAR